MNLKVQLGVKRLADYKSEGRRMSKQMGRLVVLLVFFALACYDQFSSPLLLSRPWPPGDWDRAQYHPQRGDRSDQRGRS